MTKIEDRLREILEQAKKEVAAWPRWKRSPELASPYDLSDPRHPAYWKK